ncbi:MULTISPECIES: GmrSD restriction endonuclease domain-containing protein [Burkholderia]|uniref:DUF262 domain-containing protein n=1 Tax=Burkholderia ubonensis TaxID=101571 RepID=A0A1B4LFH2_9BURK|nr:MULTISPECIES: DUF262 domain-containing protein [Burkholderia]AOJ75932.1 hypothetical protein WJ35_13260 [Burkholderia ubonensis]AOK11105.1 hypothetical protein WK31_13130 [Burkholderia vietnamiensis]RQM58071.1 DUF262 domain-containing protein [Burkholderia vietnamiensis]CAG9190227.1 conserved hypothetical protein [Burkholderia vietnamiensis]
MSTGELQLRSISQLMTESFLIPAYQRGYRWTSRQVTELLDDVAAFTERQRPVQGEFYCLQPVVVTRRNDYWELIDGQQRLTTIFLILSYFNNRLVPEERKALFALNYKTRENSASYLRSLDEKLHEENIDFFHIWHSYQAIRDWFKPRSNRLNYIEAAFLNEVKVIWYEVDRAVEPIDVFTRLNVGKIPLTNAELVKALFLRGGNFDSEGPRAKQLQQLRIAQDWDEIERRLQEEAFWYFLANRQQEANRIDLVLGLRAEEIQQVANRWDANSLFLAFNAHLAARQDAVANEWDAVKRMFLQLDEWFRDRFLYHVVGFLLSQEVKVGQIRDLARGAGSKTAFRAALKAEIFKLVFGKTRSAADEMGLARFVEGYVAQLDYESHRASIRRLLLLFNIASLLELGDSGPWFPFDHFKKDQWDLEHIRSVKSDMPQRVDAQKAWLGQAVEYFSEPELAAVGRTSRTCEQELAERLRALSAKEPFDAVAFETAFNDVIDRYDPGSDVEFDNSIGNLTLLDASTNRSYGNAIFPHKRRKLIALDKAGRFVPPCTKNAFLKYYSTKIDEMLVWSRLDAKEHQEALVSALVRFFTYDGACV